jgi:glycosyltransferase involved in cell wall biosynthesis
VTAGHAGAGRPLRVAVVAPIMVQFDAISLAARDTVRAFASDPRFEVMHFGCACAYPEIPHRRCTDVSELLLDPDYRAADAAIFHFGIHHSLFDALLAGGPPVRIVRFHNVTPARFVGPSDIPVIERSLLQVDTLRRADEIWADSPCNAEELLGRDFDPARLRVIPLVVEDPAPATLAGKPAEPVELLFISRIAPSKGVHDLLSALACTKVSQRRMRLSIAGNTAWSDPAYLARLRTLISRLGLEGMVRFVGTVGDAERERLFHAAHILAMPSYHEGFCRPVIEGLRAGCVPLVYDAYNLPHIAAGLGRVVPPGDIGALRRGIFDLAAAIPAALAQPDQPLLPIDREPTSVEKYNALVADYTAQFSFASVTREMRQRLLRLVRAQAASAVI